jgi:hypothetical protein
VKTFFIPMIYDNLEVQDISVIGNMETRRLRELIVCMST